MVRSGCGTWHTATACGHSLTPVDRSPPWPCCDRRHLLTADATSAGTVRIWDLAAGHDVAQFDGHTDRVTALRLAPDGRLAASASRDGSIRLWDLAARRCAGSLQSPAGVPLTLEFTPDGRYLLTGGDDGTLRAWDIPRRQLQRSFPVLCDPITALAVSADGELALTGLASGGWKLWRLGPDTIAPLALSRMLDGEKVQTATQRFDDALEQAQGCLARGDSGRGPLGPKGPVAAGSRTARRRRPRVGRSYPRLPRTALQAA